MALLGYGVLIRGRAQPIVAQANPFGPLKRAVSLRAATMRQSAATGSTSKSDDGAKVEIEFCGLGKTAFHADDEFAIAGYLGGLAKPKARRWLSALLNSDDNRARATGLVLEGKIDGPGFQPMAEQSRDALVQLAVGSGDPAVYAIAVTACNTYGGSATGACEQISLRGWTQLDPDNAVPWLLVASKANAQGDPAAEADAFSHAANAAKVDSYNFSLLAYAEPELPKDATPFEHWLLTVQAIGVEATTAMPQYSAAFKHCSVAAMQDNDVQKQCGRLAEVFTSKGTNLIDLSVGARLGTLAGWPQARVAGLKQEGDALMQAMMQATPAGADNQWNCSAVELGNAYTRELVQLGELGAARQVRDRSGETAEELAGKWREFLEKSLHEAARRQQEEPTHQEAPSQSKF